MAITNFVDNNGQHNMGTNSASSQTTYENHSQSFQTMNQSFSTPSFPTFPFNGSMVPVGNRPFPSPSFVMVPVNCHLQQVVNRPYPTPSSAMFPFNGHPEPTLNRGFRTQPTAVFPNNGLIESTVSRHFPGQSSGMFPLNGHVETNSVWNVPAFNEGYRNESISFSGSQLPHDAFQNVADLEDTYICYCSGVPHRGGSSHLVPYTEVTTYNVTTRTLLPAQNPYEYMSEENFIFMGQ